MYLGNCRPLLALSALVTLLAVAPSAARAEKAASRLDPASADTGGAPAEPVPSPPGTAPLVDWYDNFDSYATGSQMHGQGGWKGWDNNPAAGALTSSVQARSAPNSVDILGASDLVHTYSGYTSGQWIFTAWQFVPTGFTGQSYFILLNTYADGGPNNWSTQVMFDAGTNSVISDGVAGTLPLLRNQWVELRIEIDLDANTHAFYYGNQQLFQGSWTEGLSGGGALNIAAVDLFANGASSVYYDDMSLIGPAPAISLVKTVGTALGTVCATTTQITVPPGTTVNYCYEVTNTGNIPLSLHDLTDSELGSLLNNFPYPLAPGASVFLNQETAIATTTTNVATWSAYNVGAAPVTAVASATVYVPSAVNILEIPTLSAAGLAVLAIGLAGLAIGLIRRRAV
jgi:hypothetical protein